MLEMAYQSIRRTKTRVTGIRIQRSVQVVQRKKTRKRDGKTDLIKGDSVFKSDVGACGTFLMMKP